MNKLVILCVLPFLTTVNTGSHSLWAFATLIIGDTQFPEYSMVLMLDDVKVGYYDSNKKRFLPRGHSNPEDTLDTLMQTDGNSIFEEMYFSMKARATFLKSHFNHTHGVHVQQRLAGCDLLDNDVPGQIMSTDAFNGIDGEGISFLNKEEFTYGTIWKLAVEWDQKKIDYVKWLYANVYRPFCIKVLRSYLKQEKLVLRKVKPRVRLLQTAHPDSGGVQVSCLATGFYPRHINLTLLRDGQPVADHQITGGVLLPNGDETYQMRKSLEVSAEELREKHLYTCTASHLSLDNKLNITLEYEPGPPIVSIVSSVLVLVLVCLIVPTAAFIIWRRRRRRRAGIGSRPPLQSSYTAASSTEPSETSEDTSS